MEYTLSNLNDFTDREKLNIKIINCTLCLLSETCRAPVPGDGKTESNIMITGEAPGEEEDKNGVPFCGPSGRILRSVFDKAGLSIERKCFITNTVKCRPPSNRDPSMKEKSICSSYWLKSEIELVEPKVIIILGRVAQGIVLPFCTDMSNGSSIEIEGIQYVYFHHPSYWLRNGGESWSNEWVLPTLKKYIQIWRSKSWI